MPNTNQTKGSYVPTKPKTKSRINKRQRNRRRNKQKLLNGNQNKAQCQTQTQIAFSQRAHTMGAEIWGEAYENAVRWHGEHQNNFWRHAAEQLQNENQMLRQKLHDIAIATKKPEVQLKYETSDEDEEENKIVVKKEEDEIDSKYLEFLQVTIKHREELRLKREAADMLEAEA